MTYEPMNDTVLVTHGDRKFFELSDASNDSENENFNVRY